LKKNLYLKTKPYLTASILQYMSFYFAVCYQ